MTPTPHITGWTAWTRATVWLAGLAVALGAGATTAHGLYEVALAAGTPQALAWLYPLITDGLALVAYATTARLSPHGRRYAWTVVVVAAGLSGLTQASYLAGGVATAPPTLRFAIGAWPAIAAAVVAHLLFLLGTHPHPTTPSQATPTTAADDSGEPLPAAPVNHAATPPNIPAVPPSPRPVVQRLNTPVNAGPPAEQRSEHLPGTPRPPTARASTAPAADRALTLAREHAARHGQLPTVTELVTLARVARGTAAAALKDLRQPSTRHPTGQPADDARSHP